MLKHRIPLGIAFIVALAGAVAGDAALESAGYRAGLIIGPLLALMLWAVAFELATILRAAGLYASWAGLTWYALIGFAAILVPSGDYAPKAIGGGALIALVVALLSVARKQKTEGAIGAMSAAMLAFVYLGLTAGFVMLLRLDFGAAALLACLLVTKSYDIGAYFTGRAIGRHKLIPWLSPAKTWEGLVGGLLLAGGVGVASALLITRWDGPELALWQAFLGGVLLGGVGQMGDLFASVLKRDAGVKDSSSLLPGFGGTLDVLDSPMLAGPVAYWLLVWAVGS